MNSKIIANRYLNYKIQFIMNFKVYKFVGSIIMCYNVYVRVVLVQIIQYVRIMH